jgi:thymidylate kinase
VLITFSGLDGAGKTTLIERLRSDLSRQGRPVTVLHMNDHVGIYAWARAMRDRLLGRPHVDTPPRTAAAATRLGRLRDGVVWNKPLRRLLYPLDVLCFAVMRFYIERVRGHILILDRYFYDRLVDVADDRTGKGSALLARITPTPDLAVLLEISPEAAFARKGEYSIAYLQRRHAAYSRVFAGLPSCLRLPIEGPKAVPPALSHAVARRVESSDTRLRSAALRLLLNDPLVDLDELDWTELRQVAERGGVIVRLADAGARRGEPLPPRFAEAVARACARTQRLWELVDHLSERCTQLGIEHAFLKAAERYPDTGRDVDLLIGDTSPAVDRQIMRDVPAAVRARGFRNRLTGSRTYTAAHGIVLDIRHGRLGQFGEQARYARLLLGRAGPVPVGPSSCMAPTLADHFLLVATQQVYTRPALRLADVYWAIAALRRPEQVNWDYVFATALAMGMIPAVGAYLEYVDRMHVRLFNQSLLSEDLLERFQVRDRALLPRDHDGRFPRAPVVRRLYLSQMQSTVEAGRWNSAARLSMLPVVAALAVGGGALRAGRARA